MPTNSKERGKDGKKDRNIDQLPPTCARTWSQTHNPGMYPDQESNLQPSGGTGQCSNQPSHTGQGSNHLFNAGMVGIGQGAIAGHTHC